jgi:preprotein translocase subunit SecE
MAVAEDEKVERAEKVAKSDKGAKSGGDGPSGPSGVAGAIAWLPGKLAELRAFLTEVRAELKKVTWPNGNEVYSTTLVVMVTTVFFGFYLWGLDLIFSRVLSQVLKTR